MNLWNDEPGSLFPVRCSLKDATIVNDGELKKLGASGVLKPNNKNIQVVVGTKAEIIADEMKRQLSKSKSKTQ